MQVNVRSAKANLSKLIDAALAGEDVIIARGNKPVARLVAIAPSKFKIGILRHRMGSESPAFQAPMAPDELDLWEGGALTRLW